MASYNTKSYIHNCLCRYLSKLRTCICNYISLVLKMCVCGQIKNRTDKNCLQKEFYS